MRKQFRVVLILAFASLPLTSDAQQPRTQNNAQQVFSRADRDGDGYVDKSEAPPKLRAMFGEWDNDSDGKVSAEEFKQHFAKSRRRASPPKPGEYVAPAAKEERQPEALKAGDVAPDFTLPRVDGEGVLKLSELYREKPVVLVFGSISCSPFRQRVQQVEDLYKDHKDRVHFLMVYIREAHPDSKIMVKTAAGSDELQTFVQTDNLKLREEHAATCERTLSLSFPMVMDGVDNRVNSAYAGWPIRLVVIGTDGHVIDPGAQGPARLQP